MQGQTNMMLYNYSFLPHTINASPATLPRNSMVVGLPVISGLYNRLHNNNFTVNQLLLKRPSDDSLILNVESIINKLDKTRNIFSEYSGIDLFYFGIRTGNSYLAFGIKSHAYVTMHYPKDLAGFLWNGNTSYIGNELNFSTFNFSLTHYLSYYFAIAFRVSDRFNMGFRLASLHGLSNVSFEQMDAILETSYDPENLYSIRATNNILINTSGVEDFGLGASNSFNLNSYLKDKKNSGFGFDFGMNWKLTRNFMLTFSALDLGYIYWMSKVKNYVSSNTLVELSAVDVDVNDDENILDVYVDTLGSMFGFEEISRHYSTFLPPGIFLGGYFTHLGTNHFGGLMYWRIFKSHTERAFSVSYDKRLGNTFSFRLSWSAINNTYNNIGVGASIHLGPVQLYFLSENILGIVDPWNTNNHSFNAGILISILRVDDARDYDLIQNEYYHFMPEKRKDVEIMNRKQGTPDLEQQIKNYWKKKAGR